MTTGEGGAVITTTRVSPRGSPSSSTRVAGYGEERPDHDFPALNAR